MGTYIFGGVRMATVAERIELLHKNLAHVEEMGGEKRVAKQHEKGKLTARERLALLFDEGSFIEVNALVKSRCYNFGQEKKDLPGEGVVTGYGTRFPLSWDRLQAVLYIPRH